MINDDLARKLKTHLGKTRLARPEEQKEVFDYLDGQLEALGLEGRVSSVLVYDTVRGRISCYGERIRPENLFLALNQSIGEQGSRRTGKTSFPEIQHLTSYREGYLVPLKTPKDAYAALVNIPLSDDPEVISYHFPKSRLR
ncbi:MAG: hypothetical protein WCV90_07360 [Candidatus Woesearchaeota archaeon]|jgi:hypothetical protein